MGKLKLGLKLAKKLVDTAKKVEKPTGASPSKPKPKVKVKKKPMATKINAKNPKDKLEDAVIVGGGIGTAAVLGNKVKEKNKPKKTVKKAKGGMAKKAKAELNKQERPPSNPVKEGIGAWLNKQLEKKKEEERRQKEPFTLEKWKDKSASQIKDLFDSESNERWRARSVRQLENLLRGEVEEKEHDKWKDSFTPEEIAEATKVIETFKRREKEKEKRRSKSTDPAKPPKKIPGPQVFSKGGMAKKTSAKKTSTRSKPKGVGAATGGYGRAMR